MRGLRASQEADRARASGEVSADSPSDQLMALLDEAGFTSVVATNCDQHYVRPLVPGDHLEVTSVIDAVSSEKAHRPRASATSSPPASSSPTRTASRWPPCGSGSSSSGPARRRGGRPGAAPGTSSAPEAAPARPHPGQPVLLRGGEAAQAAHPAVHQLRHAPPSAPPVVRHLPVVRVGHGHCIGPGHHLQLRGQPLPPGAGLRLPAGRGPGRARGGHPAGGQRERHHPRGRWPSACRWSPSFEDFDDDLTLPVFRPAADRPRPPTRDEEALMDFTFNEEQRAVQEAADGALRRAGHPRPGPGGRGAARTGSTASCGPSWPRPTCSGSPSPRPTAEVGFGMVERGPAPRGPGTDRGAGPAVGRRWSSGAMPIAEFGSEALRLVSSPGGGRRRVLTAALTDVAGDIALGGTGRPSVTGEAGADGVVLSGTAFAVPSAHVADRVLVPADPRRRRGRGRRRPRPPTA